MNKKLLLMIAVFVLAITGLGAWITISLAKKLAPGDPFAGYTEATDEESERVGREFALALSKRDAKALTELIDDNVLINYVANSSKENALAAFIVRRQLKKEGLSKKLADGLVTHFDDTQLDAQFLRSRLTDKGREALVRVRPGEGVNYLALLISKNTAGKARVVDWLSYSEGQYLNEILVGFVSDTVVTSSHSVIEEIIQAKRAKKKVSEIERAKTEILEIRTLVAKNEKKMALAKWSALPESIRETRLALGVRLSAAIGDDAEYEKTVDLIRAKNPKDRSLPLLLLDYYFAKADSKSLLEQVDILDTSVGGDPFLAVIRSVALAGLNRPDEAWSALDSGMKQAPQLSILWVRALNLALETDQHAQTARFLTELREKFSIEMGDLRSRPGFEKFLRSREYAKWSAGNK